LSGPGDDPVLGALGPWLDRSARGGRGVLLAVSGGPDSTALMHAAAALREASGASVAVATVDHGLRPGSDAEAADVGRAARTLGLPHTRLPWAGPKPGTGLQEAARDVRYALLSAHAAAIGAGLVLTGHTRDDQAETVLMRLAAGSGLAGLAGMRAERALAPGLVLGRPFLHLPKAILVAWCEARGLAYLRDPSNADPRFARGRLRDAWPVLEREGLTPARLARLAERAARDEGSRTRWPCAASTSP
jgi:tRNA(Ile)-lysidine synthase